jgi:hypothetical protein
MEPPAAPSWIDQVTLVFELFVTCAVKICVEGMVTDAVAGETLTLAGGGGVTVPLPPPPQLVMMTTDMRIRVKQLDRGRERILPPEANLS